MVQDNDFLFLFRDDLHMECIKADINEVCIDMFPKINVDLNNFYKIFRESKEVVFVDEEKNLIKFLTGDKKGKIVNY